MRQTRLIDANGLMILLERELDMNGITDWGKGYMEAIHDAMEHVKFMPTIETDAVKHGSWFLLDECANEGVYCSVCHKKYIKLIMLIRKSSQNIVLIVERLWI